MRIAEKISIAAWDAAEEPPEVLAAVKPKLGGASLDEEDETEKEDDEEDEED